MRSFSELLTDLNTLLAFKRIGRVEYTFILRYILWGDLKESGLTINLHSLI